MDKKILWETFRYIKKHSGFMTVSLIVSLAWNFILQRWFVFSPTRFDSTAIRIVDSIIPQKIHKP